MFSQGKSEEVKEWAKESEIVLAEADQWVRKITQEINNLEVAAREALTLQEEERKLEFEKRPLEQKLQQEKGAAEEKRKLDSEHQQKLKEVQQTSSNQPTLKVPTVVKMHKLIISKFTGTPQDWVRFWGQFESQIEKSAVDDVTNFSYFKELFDIKVRRLIDGLPFTSEGYAKARDLLNKRYRQTIAKLLVQTLKPFLNYQLSKRKMFPKFIHFMRRCCLMLNRCKLLKAWRNWMLL